MQASKVLCALLLLALPISANAGKQIDVESVADADSVGLISPWVQKRILDDEMEFRGIESFVRAQKPAHQNVSASSTASHTINSPPGMTDSGFHNPRLGCSR